MVCEAAAPNSPSAPGYFFFLSPALLGVFTNINAGLNICCDLTGKLKFWERWNVFAIFKSSFVFFFLFLHDQQGIKL